jgi:hypothetical protein
LLQPLNHCWWPFGIIGTNQTIVVIVSASCLVLARLLVPVPYITV